MAQKTQVEVAAREARCDVSRPSCDTCDFRGLLRLAATVWLSVCLHGLLHGLFCSRRRAGVVMSWRFLHLRPFSLPLHRAAARRHCTADAISFTARPPHRLLRACFTSPGACGAERKHVCVPKIRRHALEHQRGQVFHGLRKRAARAHTLSPAHESPWYGTANGCGPGRSRSMKGKGW